MNSLRSSSPSALKLGAAVTCAPLSGAEVVSCKVPEMKFDSVLQHYGAAMVAAQRLEALFVEANIFLAEDSGEFPPNKTPRLAEKLAKTPLGRLRARWEEHWRGTERLHPDVVQYFREITAIRNYLAHHFFRFHNFEQFERKSFELQIQQLTAIRENLQTALTVFAALDHERRDKTDWSQFRQGT
jgi:hypothetical protein